MKHAKILNFISLRRKVPDAERKQNFPASNFKMGFHMVILPALLTCAVDSILHDKFRANAEMVLK